jgi:hypothetical protein
VNRYVPPTRLLSASLVTVALAGSALGCGSTKNYANDPRPPEPIVVAAAITPGGISVSPARFGAGLIQLVVSNLTTSSQQLEIVAGSGAGQRTALEQIGPINPQDTAQLKANLSPGVYTLRVSGGKVKSATLKVGAPRPTSQNQLLQP